MNDSLKNILDLINNSSHFTEDEKKSVNDWVKQADKTITNTAFKFQQTEKVKKTTSVLLEQTIQELEKKRWEAEVEASLERVRTVAMGMHRREDMLDICKTIALQLTHLGVKGIRNVQTAIFYPAKGTYSNYEYYLLHDKPIITETSFTNHKVHRDFAEQMMKGKGEFFSVNIEDVKAWLEYQKSTNVFIDHKLEQAHSLNYYWYSLGNVALGLSSYAPLEESSLVLFRRFLNVFELSFKRYLEIETAEKQAREARIEASLERVRSRTMAMQKSNELSEAANLLFLQIQSLGIPAWSAGYCIWEEDKKAITLSMSSEGVLQPSLRMPLTEDPSLKHFLEAHQRGETFFVEEVGGEVLKSHYEYLRTLPGVKETLEDIEKAGFPVPQFQIFHCAYFSKGFLLFITYEPVPDAHEIFQRFAKVFEQTYTRFLDLQRAEAQTREAIIEAALERVRYRAMAMQTSNDVGEATSTMFAELDKLGIETFRCGISLIKDQELEVWSIGNTGDGRTVKGVGRVPIDQHPLWKLFLDSTKRKEEFLYYYLMGKEKEDYIRILTTTASYSLTENQLNFPDMHFQSYHFDEGGIFAFSLHKHSESDKAVMKRFTSVFSLTFRRYLDLKNAEAQTREGLIELGLERVRARAMAMQTSKELRELIGTVFTELTRLELQLTRCVIFIFDPNTGDSRWWMANSEIPTEPMDFLVPAHEHKPYVGFVNAWRKREVKWQYILEGEDKKNWDKHLFSETGLAHLPDFVIAGMKAPEKVYLSASFNNFGCLNVASLEPLPDEHFDIMLRFAKVFDLTYTRFNDLQKAEAQAREARIESALEKIRSRTMAMQHSDELSDTASLLFAQLQELGEKPERAFIGIVNESEWVIEVWATQHGGHLMNLGINASIDEPYVMNRMYRAWKEQKKSLVIDLKGEELEAYFQYLRGLGAPVNREIFGERRFENIAFFSKGMLGIITPDEQSADAIQLFERFASVFDLTYTRFLDLKNAEAQAREAQIETSLERVRSKTMAMHNSQDVADTVATLFDELVKLKVNTIRCGIGILHEPGEMELWTAKPGESGKVELVVGRLDMMEHQLLSGAFKSWKNKEEHYSYVLEGDDLISYFNVINNNPNYPVSYDISALPSRIYHNEFHFPEGTLYVFSVDEMTRETARIFKRFAAVFGQTYRRYLDLQRAEAQARESKIEAALERIRSRSMAMHKSEELAEVAQVLFHQFAVLGELPARTSVGTFNEETRMMEFWVTDQSGEQVHHVFQASFDEPTTISKMVKGWKDKLKTHVIDLQGETLKKWIRFVREEMKLAVNEEGLRDRRVHNIAYFSQGLLLVTMHEPVSAETMDILERFASAFNLTYRRFLDLKNAEAQAHEATIEAALEKVRGKAMAMHNSADLTATASMVFTELRKLGINPLRCGVGLLNKESRKAQLYSATSGENGDSLGLVGWVDLEHHPVLSGIYDAWLRQQDYFPELSPEELDAYYKQLSSGFAVASLPAHDRGMNQYGSFLSISVGCLYAWSYEPYTEAELRILKRFAGIIDLTFRRYMELQKSEINAREAVKQASLDRVRAEIASMRTTADLEKITPLVWNELKTLGVPFIRCGVFLMDNDQQLIHTFLSSPDGKAIAAFHLQYDTPGNIQKVLNNWRNHSNYTDHWNKDDFTQFAEILVKQGALDTAAQYLKTIPPGGFYLHFLPFLQGMLYAGNPEPLKEEEMKLLHAVAEAFSTAYARYEDFNKLEAAKVQVEKTLTDLRQAQQQLVQSEKMASLGELTAGIAHEIQNPLNFVNNFSEVSSELLEEMKTEMEEGNNEEAMTLADDVRQNLEKILHHGKRADAIVKGMLQHSRTSSGQKEQTNINVLADEYLRLAFHGLRAKDKSFNAKFETDLDETIGNISIIPQDIGRVILNLINNAFYAVSEKKKQGIKDYEPTVIVKTRSLSNGVEITVSDNGNGIPKHIIDKIFQPFYTTKPTGEGTGLGLSLSYDIVTKGHGGTLKVETKEGEGSRFMIILPVK